MVCFFGRTEKKIECSSFSIFLLLGSSATRLRGSWGVVVCVHCEGGLLQRTVQQGERTLTLCCVSDSVGVAVRAYGMMVVAPLSGVWQKLFFMALFFFLSQSLSSGVFLPLVCDQCNDRDVFLQSCQYFLCCYLPKKFYSEAKGGKTALDDPMFWT